MSPCFTARSKPANGISQNVFSRFNKLSLSKMTYDGLLCCHFISVIICLAFLACNL
jgi:hypothetical protein